MLLLLALKNCCGYAQCGMVRWFEQWIFRVNINIVKFWVLSFPRFPVLHFIFHIPSIHLRTEITVVVLSDFVTEYEKTSYLLLLGKVAVLSPSRRELFWLWPTRLQSGWNWELRTENMLRLLPTVTAPSMSPCPRRGVCSSPQHLTSCHDRISSI